MNSRAIKPIREGFSFGRFELDVHARELRKDGVRLRLQDQPFEVLLMLLQQAGDVLTREDLRQRLWPDGTFVDFEHGLNAAVKRLRSALGDSADAPRFIETLHRRGYRFIGAVTPIRSGDAQAVAVKAVDAVVRVAVMPFANLGDAAAGDYFSEGLSEEMITQLGRLSGDRLRILARFSSVLARQHGRPAHAIGEVLRADYLVEGTVRRDGDRVRISAQLIDTRTETQVWADAYERRLADCFLVQSDVAAQIVQSLAVELLPGAAASRIGTRDTGAHQAYLKGRYHWNKAGDTGLHEAVGYFERAVVLDPDFATAYAALSRVHVAAADYYVDAPRQTLEAARVAAERALELDPSDSEAHLALAEVRKTVDWDWDGAEAGYRFALAFNPCNEAAHRLYGLFLAARGRTAEAALSAARACDLDPLCLVVNTSAAWVRYLARDYDLAIDWCRHTLDMDRAFAPAHRVMAAALLQVGRVREAVDALTAAVATSADPVSLACLAHATAVEGDRARALQLTQTLAEASATRYVSRYHVALAEAALGDTDRACASLAAAFEARDPAIANLRLEPRFEPLRFDAQYRALVDRLGLNHGR